MFSKNSHVRKFSEQDREMLRKRSALLIEYDKYISLITGFLSIFLIINVILLFFQWKLKHGKQSSQESRADTLIEHDIIRGKIENTSDYSVDWYIKNFTEITDKKICSEPFQIPTNKYTFRLIMYPRGDKSADNEYMSLYFQMMSGKEDEQLTWPMKENVALEIVNLETESKSQLCKKTYSYNNVSIKDKDVFQKPMGRANTMYGHSEFMYTSLSNGFKYIDDNDDDSIRIKFSMII